MIRASSLIGAVAVAWGIAQTPATPAAGILGTWRGTSTCVDQKVDTSCHDEEVVYLVDSAMTSGGPVRIAADKIVGGVRDPMGTFRLEYDAAAKSWSVDFTTRTRVRWTFEPRGEAMTGTLKELPSGRLIRRIAVRRVP